MNRNGTNTKRVREREKWSVGSSHDKVKICNGNGAGSVERQTRKRNWFDSKWSLSAVACTTHALHSVSQSIAVHECVFVAEAVSITLTPHQQRRRKRQSLRFCKTGRHNSMDAVWLSTFADTILVQIRMKCVNRDDECLTEWVPDVIYKNSYVHGPSEIILYDSVSTQRSATLSPNAIFFIFFDPSVELIFRWNYSTGHVWQTENEWNVSFVANTRLKTPEGVE